jgi:uncharacterized protein
VSGTCLLDVNVLLAMIWPRHEAHAKVQQWLSRSGREKWATCPFTETAFVRILSNPAFSRDALTPADALRLLEANLAHPAHQFWSDDLGFPQAISSYSPRIVGHQQVTDAYLLGLAIHKKGKLATLDRALATVLPESSFAREALLLI